jgi:hypothetical protein
MNNKKYTFGDLAIILQDEFGVNMGVVNVGDSHQINTLTKEEAQKKLYEILKSLADQFCTPISN